MIGRHLVRAVRLNGYTGDIAERPEPDSLDSRIHRFVGLARLCTRASGGDNSGDRENPAGEAEH
jgi:hypothetical protein